MPARNLFPFRKLNLINSVVLGLYLTCCFVDAGSVGWFYALDSDKVAFEKIVGSPLRTVSLTGGTVMNEYRVGPHRVVAAKMGSGCVTTAVTVTRVMALNPFDRLISTGPAGGIAEGYQRGEWVRVTETVGWQQGKIGESGQEHSTKDISNEEVMDISSWPPGKWREVRGVKLVSGEAFVASSEHRSELARNYQAQIVEMNSLGILTSLQQTSVKILILRVISDFANEQANADFAAFLQSYQGEGGTMVAEMVKNLPVGQDEPGAHDALKKLLED
jgi:adenosylhomocysteine nucleosidase